jgi:hypothetical protein
MNYQTCLDSLLHRLADLMALTLDPDEQHAVCGDIAEARESGSQALLDVLSLVVRRRGACLLNSWPWLAVVGLSLPLGALVSLESRRISDGSAIDLWLYLNNWDWAYFRNSGFLLELGQCISSVLSSYLALACWSWTSGLMIGRFGRRTLWFSGAAFLIACVIVSFWGIPHFFDHILVLSRARDFPSNAAVFLNAFYSRLLPVYIGVLLVALPAWRGMVHGRRLDEIPRMTRAVTLIAAVAALCTLLSSNLYWWQMRVWYVRPLRLPRLPSLTPLAIAGPAFYMLLTALERRRRARC